MNHSELIGILSSEHSFAVEQVIQSSGTNLYSLLIWDGEKSGGSTVIGYPHTNGIDYGIDLFKFYPDKKYILSIYHKLHNKFSGKTYDLNLKDYEIGDLKFKRVEFEILNLGENSLSLCNDIYTREKSVVSNIKYVGGVTFEDLINTVKGPMVFIEAQQLLIDLNRYIWETLGLVMINQYSTYQLSPNNIKVNIYEDNEGLILKLVITDLACCIRSFVIKNKEHYKINIDLIKNLKVKLFSN